MMSFFNRLLSISSWEKSGRKTKLILFTLFALGIAALCWSGVRDRAIDFVQRYRMGVMVRYGQDPATVVNDANARIDLPESLVPPDFSPYHIDFPWTQSFFALLSTLNPKPALVVFQFLQICCLVLSMIICVRYLTRKFHIERLLATMLVSLFFLCSYVRTDIKVGNTGLFALCGMLLLYYGWENKKVWIEAIGVALLCMKPQTGFLFVLLLMLERHFVSLVLAGIICFLVSVPEMIWLHKIPWDFLRNMLSVKFVFSVEPQTCGFFCVCYQIMPQKVLMACNMIVAVAILVFYWWRFPVKDPMLKLLPAAIGTMFWTYSRTYHLLFLIVPLLCLTGMLKSYEEENKPPCFVALLMVLLWLPLKQTFPTYIFLVKYLVSIFAIFYIGNHYRTKDSCKSEQTPSAPA